MKRIGLFITALALAAGIAAPPPAAAQQRAQQPPTQIKVFEGTG